MTESQKQIRIYDLVMAEDHYRGTGVIREVLLTCFNQHGEWVGTGVNLPDLNVSGKLGRTKPRARLTDAPSSSSAGLVPQLPWKAI